MVPPPKIYTRLRVWGGGEHRYIYGFHKLRLRLGVFHRVFGTGTLGVLTVF